MKILLMLGGLVFVGTFVTCWCGCAYCYIQVMKNRLPGVGVSDFEVWSKLNEEGKKYRGLFIGFWCGGVVSFGFAFLLLNLAGRYA